MKQISEIICKRNVFYFFSPRLKIKGVFYNLSTPPPNTKLNPKSLAEANRPRQNFIYYCFNNTDTSLDVFSRNSRLASIAPLQSLFERLSSFFFLLMATQEMLLQKRKMVGRWSWDSTSLAIGGPFDTIFSTWYPIQVQNDQLGLNLLPAIFIDFFFVLLQTFQNWL